MAQKERRFQTVFMLVIQTCIFYVECMITSSNLLANFEKLCFSLPYSFLHNLLHDCFCFGSSKQTQRQGSV